MKTLSIGLVLSLVVATTSLSYLHSVQQQAPSLKQVLTEEGLNVKQRLDSLYNDLVRLRSLAGWEVERVKVVENNALFFLKNDGGFITTLRPWAERNGFLLSVDEHGVTLLSGLRVVPPLQNHHYMPVLETSVYLSDAIRFIHLDSEVNFAKDEAQQDYKRRETTFSFKQLPYQDLVDIGTAIDGLPISFNDGELKVNAAGELAGEFKLSIYGV